MGGRRFHLPYFLLVSPAAGRRVALMSDAFREPLKKRVGGSLSRLPVLARLEMLRRNAILFRGGEWQPPANDGTLVRKTVGRAR